MSCVVWGPQDAALLEGMWLAWAAPDVLPLGEGLAASALTCHVGTGSSKPVSWG